jgi:ATP/maltotriose-dependent transcriptional regulator MalT
MRYLALLDSEQPAQGMVALLGAQTLSDGCDALSDAVVLIEHPDHSPLDHSAAQMHRLTRVALDSLLRAAQAVRTDAAHAVSRPLSARERQVLSLMADGLNNGEIARHLNLSLSTVKFHVSAILAKLAVDGRVEAVAHAVRDGLVVASAPVQNHVVK